MKETLDRVAEFGGTIKTHECDVTQSASVKAMIDACVAAFGGRPVATAAVTWTLVGLNVVLFLVELAVPREGMDDVCEVGRREAYYRDAAGKTIAALVLRRDLV